MNNFFAAIDWSPTIGDPTFIGWFTVFAYFVTFLVSLRVISISNYIFARRRAKQKQLWMVISALFIFLCINKQLDLQSFFTGALKYFFREWGIYEYRRGFQKLFIIGVLIIGFGVLIYIFKQLWIVIKKHILAVIGVGFLLTFVLIRAASFHNVDYFLFSDRLGFKMNWLLELGGIALVLVNGILLIKRRKKIRIVLKKKTKKQSNELASRNT